jgi:hypothetical protein
MRKCVTSNPHVMTTIRTRRQKIQPDIRPNHKETGFTLFDKPTIEQKTLLELGVRGCQVQKFSLL